METNAELVKIRDNEYNCSVVTILKWKSWTALRVCGGPSNLISLTM